MSKPQISNEDLGAAYLHHSAEDHNVHWMARELIERRAADLTAAEVEALRFVQVSYVAHDCFSVEEADLRGRGLDVLVKLLKAHA